MTSLRHSRGADNIVMSILNNVATHFQSRKQCSGQMLSYLRKQLFGTGAPLGPVRRLFAVSLALPGLRCKMCRAVPLRDSPSSALLLHDHYSKQQITLLKVHRTLQRYSHRMNAAKLNRLYQSVLKSRPVSFSSLRARCRNQREHLTTRRV